MADERHCNECGADLPADAPQGLCPQCLMKLGLPSAPAVAESPPADDQAAVPTSATPPGGFIPPQPGQLAEKFPQLEIFELLGQGGMGAVYKARQKQLDRVVALKILPPQVGQDPAFAERFSREARSLAKLNHTRIVSIYDFGHTEDGLYYFIMEFVDGTDLRHVIEGGHLEPSEALAIVPQICEALQYAHEEGLVHRDIKPENILLDKKGMVKIADFGLAKLLGKPATAYTLTQAGQRMGTPHYMAPEQIEGAHQVDHRADIYSLGVVFYEMLTGQLPIGRFAPPSQKVQVDVRLDDVVLKSLEHEPEQRYQKVSEVRTDVEKISQCEQPLTTAEQLPEPRFSRRAIAGAACIPLAVPLVVMLSTKEGYDRFENLFTPTGENWGQWVFTFIVSVVGIAAPFATTILGFISLSEIRRSQGRLVGLPLALADAMLFPLIVVDFFIFMIFLSNQGLWGESKHIPLLLPVVLLICAVVDLLLIRWAWRKARAGTERPKPRPGRSYTAAAAGASPASSQTLQTNRRIDEIETEVEAVRDTVSGARALSLIVRHPDVYAGFAEAHGILKLEGDDLGLEYQIEDGIFGVVKSSVKTARIPLDQIASIKVQPGRRKMKLTLRTSTWKALDNVPGSKAGLVALEVSREHMASAKSFIEQLKERLPEGTIEGYQEPQAEPDGDADHPLDGIGKAMMTGGIALLAGAVPTAMPFLTDSSLVRRWTAKEWSVGTILLAILVVMQAVAIPVGGIIITAAKNLKRRQSYGFTVAAGILMLLPLGIASALTIPLGIWVLVELSREEVKELFQRQASDRDLSRRGKWNSYCIAAFLISLVGLFFCFREMDPGEDIPVRIAWATSVVFSSVFGIVGLVRARKYSGIRGSAFGIAALVVALAALVGFFVTIYYPVTW